LHLQREAEVAKILGIPDGYRQGALLPTAYYTGETFKPAPRDPLDTTFHQAVHRQRDHASSPACITVRPHQIIGMLVRRHCRDHGNAEDG
jgi:hypothetical protein